MIKRSMIGALWIIALTTPTMVNAQSGNRISLDSYKRIKNGMTELEVEKVFGTSFGQHTTGKIGCTVPTVTITLAVSAFQLPAGYLSYKGDELMHPYKAWIGNELAVWVYFDKNGRVVASSAHPVCPAPYELSELLWSVFQQMFETAGNDG